jgi:small subunit ribosomal protein S27Ae
MAKGKKKGYAVSKVYDLSSGIKRKNKFCPKCGEGFFLAQHSNRLTCGKCRYSEIKK